MSRFGLRGQLVAALSLAFVLAFSLLGFAALQLGRRSRDAAHRQDAIASANVFAAAMQQDASRVAFLEYAEALIGRGGIRGVEADVGVTEPWSRGVTHLGDLVASDNGSVRLWVRAAGDDGQVFGRLMLLYVSVTVGAILLLTFWALTRLIVRPVDALTRAAERMSAGRLDVTVPLEGAREVAALASNFNLMAKQLAAERATLQRRLDELERASRELESAERQVERSAHLASVGRLAAGVAHEIGNPLTAITGLVELAQSDELPGEKRNEFLSRVEKETARIQRIIRELLDFARPDTQDTVQVRLADVVESAVHLVAPQRDASKIRIEQRVDRSCQVLGTMDGLTQVLLNLLLNAADAVGGEGEILVEVEPAGPNEEADDQFVRLSVYDSGPGIDAAIVDSIFEPFVTSKGVGEGTGLGLAVCHTIVERLGGRMHAENVEGGGARFIVELRPAP